MGGTFDPIHIAHLVAASEVHSALKLDRVIFIPAGQPWQKAHLEIAPAEKRLEMVNRAISGDSRFQASDVEISRSGPTYAIDTVQQLKQENPSNEYFWIVGTDALRGMSTWHNFAELQKLITIVAVNRNGVSSVAVDFPYTFVEMPEIQISATEIRSRIHEGKPINYLVPSAVVEFISSAGLYK